jgi:hypothetical protein
MSIVLCKVLGDAPCYLKPFLHIKHIDGTGKECLIHYTRGYAYAKCLVIPVEDLEMFKIWAISLVGWMSGGRIKKEKSQINWRPL